MTLLLARRALVEKPVAVCKRPRSLHIYLMLKKVLRALDAHTKHAHESMSDYRAAAYN